MNENTTTLALVAIVGTVITALFKLLANNTKATASLVEETKKGNYEAKERNGHLGEQNVQIAQLVTSQGSDIHAISESNAVIAKILAKSALIAAEDRDILTTGNQVVKEQHVEKQIVDKKETR